MNTVEGWSSITLGEVCKFTGGNGFREELQGQKDGDYPFIKVSDMELPGNKKAIVEANNWIDEKTRTKEAFKAFPELSVVFAKVGAALLLNRRRILTRPTCIDNNMMAAVPSGIEPLFLYYVLSDIDFAYFVQSGAVPSINQGQLSSILFVLPKPNEQAKIAEILSTVDRAIEQTEALIAKQQRIKTGLMQDLLTRGIDEHGNLRSEKTHKFKDSPLGRIPVEWEVVPLSELADAIDPQPDHRTPAEVSDGVPYVGVSDFGKDGGIDFNRARKVSLAALRKQQRAFSISENDFVFGKIGTIGIPQRIPAFIEYALSANVILLKPFETPSFIYWWMASQIVERLVDLEIHTTSQPAFGIQKMRAFRMLKPSKEERHRIGDLLDKLGLAERGAERDLQKLHSLKTALMQDLLTGKKRVTSLLEKEVSTT